MKEDYKIKSFLSFGVFILLAFAISYIVVYNYSFMPSGYEIKEVQDNHLLIQGYNMFGGAEEDITYSPNSDEKWEMVELKHQINRLHGFYLLLYAAVLISLYSFKLKRMEGLKKRAAFIQSGIVMSIIGVIIPIIQVLERIKTLLN